MNRAERALTRVVTLIHAILASLPPAVDPRPHASGGLKLLFPGHHVCLNDVKDRVASDVTERNGAFQGHVKRPATLERHPVGHIALAKGPTEMGLPEMERSYYGEDQRGDAFGMLGIGRSPRRRRVLRRYAVAALFALVSLAGLLVVENTVPQSFRTCVDRRHSAEGPYKPDDYGKRALVLVSGESVCSFRFVDQHEGAFSALAAFVVAGFAFALWRSTEKLWDEARSSRAHARRTAFAGLVGANAARRSAKAAQQSADALLAAERAYVSVKEYRPVILNDAAGNMTGFQCVVVWENSGATPTKDMEHWVSWQKFSKQIDGRFDYPDLGKSHVIRSYLGPKTQLNSVALTISLAEILAIIKEEVFIYVWGWADYNDVFPGTHRHRTEFCVRVVGVPLDSNRLALEFRHHPSHNSGT